MVELKDDQAAKVMGLSPDRLQNAWNVIRSEIARGITPSAVAMVTRHGHSVRFAAGYASEVNGKQDPVNYDTIYDVASLTKVVATLPLMLMLIEQGKVRLKDPVSFYLPEFASMNKAHVTVGHLLTHTSGLAPFYDMHTHGWSREKIMSFIYQSTLEYETGTKIIYSDLGFILLGEIISTVLGIPLDQAAHQFLYQPLGMKDTGFIMPEQLKSRIAVTEYDSALGEHLHGIVHDENARALGGICGHAGVFSTVSDLSRYAQMWLDGGLLNGEQLLSRTVMEASIVSKTAGIVGGNRGIGWQLKGDKYDASGDLLSNATYGHTGFTGTSLYIDPVNELSVVLLTNRVHHGRSTSVARLRECFHNAVVSAII